MFHKRQALQVVTICLQKRSEAHKADKGCLFNTNKGIGRRKVIFTHFTNWFRILFTQVLHSPFISFWCIIQMYHQNSRSYSQIYQIVTVCMIWYKGSFGQPQTKVPIHGRSSQYNVGEAIVTLGSCFELPFSFSNPRDNPSLTRPWDPAVRNDCSNQHPLLKSVFSIKVRAFD